MSDPIFTTRGYLPADRVELRKSVTEDGSARYHRTDKFDRVDGAWVGNDLHIELKASLPLFGETGQFS